MKKIFISALACLFAFHVSAEDQGKDQAPGFNPVRNWTSSEDPSKSFSGKVSRYDGKTATITPKGKTAIVLPVDKLSEEDRTWLEENADFIGKFPSEIAKLQATNTTPLGKELTASTLLQGKIKPTAQSFIILFSASWCPPCRAEAPKVVQLYNEKIAKDPKVELILASCDNDEEAAKKWSGQENMPFPIIAKKDWNKIPALQKISPPAIPTGFLLDQNGEVVEKGLPMKVYGKTGKK